MSWRIPWIRFSCDRIPGIQSPDYVLRHRCRDTIPYLGLDRPDRLNIQVRNIAGKIKYSLPSIMTNGSCKCKERESLTARVTFSGLEMPPCSYCKKHDQKCIVAPDSSRCSEYIRLKRKCNVEGPSASDWRNIDSLKERLEREAEETAELMVTVAAKLACIQKQQQLLRTRAQDMLKYGLKSLDELDEVEAKEKEEKEAQERTAVNSAALADPAWLDPLSDKQLYQLLLDFPEGTAELQPSY
jgi:hypothetical protein